MSPRESPATAAELARAGLFASLAGQPLERLARRMRRDELAAAESLEDPGRFYVVLRGMITAGGRVFRPGETLGPGIGAVRAVTPATLASCDAETYEELVRPLCG